MISPIGFLGITPILAGDFTDYWEGITLVFLMTTPISSNYSAWLPLYDSFAD